MRSLASRLHAPHLHAEADVVGDAGEHDGVAEALVQAGDVERELVRAGRCTIGARDSTLAPSSLPSPAAAILSSVPITIVFPIAQRYLVSGLADGGVKG